MISLTINGKTIETQEGTTVLKAAEAAGITIPTLCYHKDLSPYGGCRLCVVEIQGNRLPSTSCNLLASQGMIVQTESAALTEYRRFVLRMLLRNFYDGGYKHSNGKLIPDDQSEFACWVRAYAIDLKSTMAQQPFHAIDCDPNPYVWVDRNKCILCHRCVRACAEVQGRFVWEQAFRGNQAAIVSGAETTMLQARCESCGACVAYCPTGALDNKMSISLGRADRSITTTCPYCSVGCQFNLEVKKSPYGEKVIRVSSYPEAAVNGMHLCIKGRYGYDFVHRSDRILQPRVRRYLLDNLERPADRGSWVDTTWDTALDVIARQLVDIKKKDGPDSIGILASGKMVNEENYLLNKLARQVLETNNIDLCSHANSSGTVAGLEKFNGKKANPATMDEVAANARSLLIMGSNITEENPVFGAKIRQAVLRRGMKVVVAAPSFINIEEYAALSLRYRPGTEVALINGLMNIILENGWVDTAEIKADSEGLDQLETFIKKYPPLSVAEITGVCVEALYQAAKILTAHRPTAIVWGSGVAHPASAANNVLDLINLALLLNERKANWNNFIPLRSHANSQGASDMGALPGFFPGYQPVTSDAVREKFAKAWGTALPGQNGLAAAEMIAGAREGAIKALYIAGEDLITDETSHIIRSALLAAHFVVVQGIFPSQTTHYADVLLPGVSFAEKTGTFTNSEHRIQLVRQAIHPLGQAHPDWQVITELARRLLDTEARSIADTPYSGWNYSDTSRILEEVANLTPSYSGVSHQQLEAKGYLYGYEQVDLRIHRTSGEKNGFIPIPFVPRSKIDAVHN